MTGRLRHMVRFWWASIPDPRLVSAGFAVAYGLAVLGGLRTLVSPPSGASADAHGLVVMVGWFLIAGGVFSAAAGWADAWAFERLGLALLIMATIAYTLVLAASEFRGEARSVGLTMTAFGLVLFVIRLGMIWRFTRRPRG